MRRSLFLVAIALLGGACAPANSREIEDAAKRDLAISKSAADRDLIKLRCPDGAVLAPGCGLLLARVSTQEFRTAFHDKRCADKSDEQCQALFERDVDKSLRERYWAADRQSVGKQCEARPGRCDDPLALETDLLTSHNIRVQIEASNRQMAIESARDAAHRADQAGAQARTNDVLFDLLGPRCRTHYSLLGGTTQTCTKD